MDPNREKKEDLTRATELVREAADLSRAHMSEAAEELTWIAEVMEGEIHVIRSEEGLWPA
ncbi:MAG: hypothetical protein J6Z79_03505 [Clostridia bacterium]|nr:hypothetical protein [Clostridia bacterium]